MCMLDSITLWRSCMSTISKDLKTIPELLQTHCHRLFESEISTSGMFRIVSIYILRFNFSINLVKFGCRYLFSLLNLPAYRLTISLRYSLRI